MPVKQYLSPDRVYRERVHPHDGEVCFRVGVEQTDLLVVAESDLQQAIAAYVTQIRGEIKTWIMFHPEFAESLEPLAVPDGAPAIIQSMIEASAICGVGPMATVAGAISQAVGDRFAALSPNLLVENGGDTYLHSTKERIVALLPEPDSGAMIGIALDEMAFPVSICASSGVIGHSLSLGTGDLVAVKARDARLADAAATSLCNLLKGRTDINRVLERAKELSEFGLQGIFAQCDKQIAVWGALELVAVE